MSLTLKTLKGHTKNLKAVRLCCGQSTAGMARMLRYDLVFFLSK